MKLRAIDVALSAIVSGVIVSLAALTKSFWGDEIQSLQFATQAGAGVFAALAGDYHPPVYFLLLKAWVALFGSSEIALRAFQGVQGGALLLAALLLFRKLVPERRFHPFWVLLALSSEFWLFMPMLRYYTLAATLVLFSSWLLLRWLDDPRQKTAALLAGLYAVLLYTDLPSSFAIALHLAYVTVSRRAVLLRYLVVCLAAGAAFLPWLGITIRQAHRLAAMGAVADLNASPAAIVLKVAYSLYAFVFGEMTYPFEGVAIVAGIALVAAGIVAARQLGFEKGRAPLALLAAVVAGTLFTALITSIISRRTSFIYTPSRTFYGLPLLYLGFGLAYSRLESRAAKRLLLAPFVLLALYGDANWILSRHFMMPVYATPWKEVLGALRGEGGVVIADQSLCYEYYRDRLAGSYPAPVVQIDRVNSTVFLILLGRESTESQVAPEIAEYLATRGTLEYEKKFLPIDEAYRRFKARVSKRDTYDSKVTLRKYRLAAGG